MILPRLSARRPEAVPNLRPSPGGFRMNVSIPVRGALILIVSILSMALPDRATAVELRIAVASNFVRTAHSLVEMFEQSQGYRPQLVTASTGKHYAQILNGAPFDVFMAADALRPALLEEAGLTVPGTRFTYALGILVLWSPDPGLISPGEGLPESSRFRFLGLANPDLAPYGYAAREVLTGLGSWKRLQAQLVRGENVSQALQFVHSGAAELGFVAQSQVMQAGGSRWLVPDDSYTPIAQQVVQLSATEPGLAFLDFLRSPAARDLIEAHGYEVP